LYVQGLRKLMSYAGEEHPHKNRKDLKGLNI
jgi:hypothetical protein